MLFLLFIFISYIRCNCDIRTPTYSEHGSSNDNAWYFDSKTYSDSTESIGTIEYRNIIKSTVQCTGQWCIDDEWKCNIGDSRSCYNVEHIIPKANDFSEISGCSVDIRGNLIMSYGKWNQQMSNGFYGEKIAVYGSDIVQNAYKNVYKACYNKENPSFPYELCINNIRITVAYVLLGVMIVMVGISIIFAIKYYYPDMFDKYKTLI